MSQIEQLFELLKGLEMFYPGASMVIFKNESGYIETNYLISCNYRKDAIVIFSNFREGIIKGQTILTDLVIKYNKK